jgi:hypothetical protein
VDFGSSGAFLRQTNATTYNYSDNFGMEIWVKSGAVNQTGAIFINGAPNSGTGFSLYQNGANYSANLGNYTVGGAFFGSSAVSTGAWTHLALVRDTAAFGGTQFYVNGVLNGTIADSSLGINGYVATSSLSYEYLSVGARLDTTNAFNGSTDDARLFTFTSGAFNVSDLNYAAVPEPSAYVLMLLGLSALVVLRRKFVSTKA